MTDVYSPEKRSEVMSLIRSSGTGPEDKLHAAVTSILGHRWRIDRNLRSLPGSPDLVVPSLNLVIFLDGCFFHSCPIHGRIPDSNQNYWKPKLERTVIRDRRNRRMLRQLGFSVSRFWEHDFKTARATQLSMLRLHRSLELRVRERRQSH